MDNTQVQTIFTNFSRDLQLSSEGTKTSLAFIRNTLPSSPLVVDGETFQTLGIGGSMYHSALVQKTGDELKILQSIIDKQPAFLTKEDFLAFIETKVEEKISKIALNFAYPLEPVFTNGRLDGKLVKGSKENTFTGMVGEPVGEAIEKHILQKQNKKIVVSAANDTVCLILSGLTQTSWDHLAAGIVGTGLNFALFLDQDTVVNLESGDFNNFLPTETGKAIDASSNMQGRGLFEKEVSGGYLYLHFNELIKQGKITHQPLTNTTELSYLAVKNIPGISDVAYEQIKRSAEFVAAQIAGIMIFKKQSLTFVMQGSLFWKGHNYKELVKEFTKKLAPEYECRLISVDDSDILGAAKLIA